MLTCSCSPTHRSRSHAHEITSLHAFGHCPSICVSPMMSKAIWNSQKIKQFPHVFIVHYWALMFQEMINCHKLHKFAFTFKIQSNLKIAFTMQCYKLSFTLGMLVGRTNKILTFCYPQFSSKSLPMTCTITIPQIESTT